MNKIKRHNNDLTDNGDVIIVAKDIVRSIIEGQVDIVDKLVSAADKDEIVLLKSCICEGLNLAQPVTASGLHALGRLISVSRLVNYSDAEDRKLEGQRHSFITVDALLSCLIGALGARENLDIFDQLWLHGIMPLSRDAELVVALLAARDGDAFHVSTFARSLELIYFSRVDSSMEERQRWIISDEYADKLRSEATQSAD